MRGYVKTRRRFTICETFGQFVRGLAKEWNEFSKESLGRYEGETQDNFVATGGILTADGLLSIIPSFKKNAASRFNAAHYRSKRANQGLNHTVVRVKKQSYCVLCGWSFNWRYKGKLHQKKGGNRRTTWCNVCRQAICISCWDVWHSTDVLKRAVPSEMEMGSFKNHIREKYMADQGGNGID